MTCSYLDFMQSDDRLKDDRPEHFCPHSLHRGALMITYKLREHDSLWSAIFSYFPLLQVFLFVNQISAMQNLDKFHVVGKLTEQEIANLRWTVAQYISNQPSLTIVRPAIDMSEATDQPCFDKFLNFLGLSGSEFKDAMLELSRRGTGEQWGGSSVSKMYQVEKERRCLLQEIRRGTAHVQDPRVQEMLREMPYCCAPEVLTFLIDKGMVFDEDCAHKLATEYSVREYFLPKRLENIRILMKAGYKVNIEYWWQRQLIFYLCKCHSQLSGRMTYFKMSHLNDFYTDLAKLILSGSHPNCISEDSFNKQNGTTVFLAVLDQLGSIKQKDDNIFCLNRETLLLINVKAFFNRENQYVIINALLSLGADPRVGAEHHYTCVKKVTGSDLRFYLDTFNSFPINKAAIFQAIETRNSKALKAVAQRITFLVRNAEGDNPLHFAVKKSVETLTDAEKEKLIAIIGLILRILPQLLSEKNTKEGVTPLVLIVGSHRSLLPYFQRLCATSGEIRKHATKSSCITQ